MRKIAFYVVFAFALLYFGHRFLAAIPQAKEQATQPLLPHYNRVNWWILSARCTQHTHSFLAICGPSGQLWPIEHFFADDRGEALLANFNAFCLKRPFTLEDMAFLNLSINAFSLWILSFLFLWLRLPVVSLLCLCLGAKYGLPGPLPGADAQASFFGEYCLMLLAPLIYFQISFGTASRLSRHFGLVSAFLTLILVYMLRQPIGLIALLIVCLLHVFWILIEKHTLQQVLFRSVLLLSLMVLVVFSPSLTVTLRNRLFGLSTGERVLSHGLSHTLYLGLGTEPNPWGIDYNDDASGQLAVAKMHPEIGFETPAYYQMIGHFYWELVRRYPADVCKIYMRKIGHLVEMPLAITGIPIFWQWLFWSIIAIFMGVTKIAGTSWDSRIAVLQVLAVGLFCFQGVLAIPSPQFLYPAKFGVILLMLCCMQALWDCVASRIWQKDSQKVI